MTKRITKDSGKREDFVTGARRDTECGKQSMSNVQLRQWNDFLLNHAQPLLDVDTDGVGDTGFDQSVVVKKLHSLDGTVYGVKFYNLTKEGRLVPAEMLIDIIFLNRLQSLMQRGAEKYESWNWIKGIPLLRFFTSAIRHLVQWRWGDVTEDHLAGVAFNIMGAMGTEHRIAIGILPDELAEGVGVLDK